MADKELHEQMVRPANDPRLITRNTNPGYDITEADDDNFMLNGRSFPYTLRESLALHLHGHKPTAPHYDGVDEGGDISRIAYKDFINDKGIPEVLGMSRAPYFVQEFWQRKYPIWQDYDTWKNSVD